MIKTYYYRTWSSGRAGCSSGSPWNECKAQSKAEIIRDRKSTGRKVEIMSEAQFMDYFDKQQKAGAKIEVFRIEK